MHGRHFYRSGSGMCPKIFHYSDWKCIYFFVFWVMVGHNAGFISIKKLDLSESQVNFFLTPTPNAGDHFQEMMRAP